MTVVMCSNHSISYSRQLGHHLHQRNLQPKYELIYGRGVSHVRTGESMSSPPQVYIHTMKIKGLLILTSVCKSVQQNITMRKIKKNIFC
jgi:hypothetical protein